jgi:VanZ family protein
MITRRRGKWLALYMLGLLLLTLAPLPRAANALAAVDGFDKVVHFVLLGGLAVVVYWNLAAVAQPKLERVVGLCAAVAALIELLQAPLPYRTSDVWDFFWGTMGALVAYVLAARLAPRR